MRPVSTFSWFIVVFVPLTLAWKLFSTGVGAGADDLRNRMVTFLSMHEYNIAQQTIIADEPVIHAERDACKIIISGISPEGWSRDLFQKMTSSLNREFFVFDGKIYPDQPVWTTVTSDRWSAYLRRLGIGRPRPLLLAVAETSSCDAEKLPWVDLMPGAELTKVM